jgi:signal transduction histidine kinase
VARATALPRRSQSSARTERLSFGLRPRLLAALALTSVVTLTVAALALLPPLKSRLNSDALSRAESAVELAKPGLASLPLVRGRPPRKTLAEQARSLRRRDAAERVIVWPASLTKPLYDTDSDVPLLTAKQVAASSLALKNKGKPRDLFQGGLLTVAIPYSDAHDHFVLEIFTRLDYVKQATDVVVVAFLEAAAAGLAVALLLGVALSSRLVRRLQMLRDATSGFDEGGFDERELADLVVPEDVVRDEIGELARAFAQMRGRLRQQEQARRAFVATASHELRTPLASLDGMLELLADDLENEPVDVTDARKRVALAQQQSQRLANLATDLLDLSRLDSTLELRSEPVELGELARAVSAEFELRALERERTIAIDHPGAQRWAEGDPGGVARIVRILLDNALRIAPAHSTVTIRVGGSDDGSSLEVSDDGPGVLPDERELIFQRFHRGSARGDESGFGLGLAIGRELAERMGGTLELVNGPPGATFRLNLNTAMRGAPVA